MSSCDILLMAIPVRRNTGSKPPDLPLEIWLEIFQFATHVHRATTIAPLDPFTLKHVSHNAMGSNTPLFSLRTKCALVLVCRSWRRIAVQILYQYIVIRSPRRADMILATLQGRYQIDSPVAARRCEYGQWTRHIGVYTHARGAKSLRYLHTVFLILQCCPNLRMFSGTWVHQLPIQFLNGISQLYGSSLQGLYWNEQRQSPDLNNTLATPEFLASFRSLHILDLSHFIGSDLSERTKTTLQTPTLPCVQDIILSTHPQSLRIATFLTLPALRHLTLKTPITAPILDDLITAFLKAHGLSLTSVDLPTPSPGYEPEPDTVPQQSRRSAQHVNPSAFLEPHTCPNLVSITFPCASPLLAPHIHTSLRRIGLRDVKSEALYPDKPTHTRAHLMSFTRNVYPNLEVIRTIGFLVGAKTEKDSFIWWTERFDKQGVDFQDGEGVLWFYLDPDVGPDGRVHGDLGGDGNESVGVSKAIEKPGTEIDLEQKVSKFIVTKS